MSGIAAVIHFDGSDVDPGTIERLTAEMGYRGPDGITHWQQGCVALGFCALHTTAESLSSPQPLFSADGQLVLVLDGFLHNLNELKDELAAKGAQFHTGSDAEVVLRAYEAWGDDCPLRLEGEFAFVLWNRRRQTAFCARDHAGLRPLHYHWDGKRLTIASDLGPIMVAPGVSTELNKAMIAQILANEWITRGETVWTGVMRLLPATSARFDNDGMRSALYWSPPTEVTIRYRRDEDYFEHYRHLLEECVRRTSRSHLPIASDVSGGLDSSAVFAVAEDLRRQGKLLAPDVKGYTYKFQSGSAPDELEYARSVAAHVGAKVREIEPFFPELAWFEERACLDRDMAPYPNSAMAVNIGKAAVEDGCRVLMNGEGGDEWLGGRAFYYAEQIAERSWPALWRTVREDISEIGMRSTSYRLARFGLAPHAPETLMAILRKAFHSKGPNAFSGAFWLDPEIDRLLKNIRQSANRSSAMAIANRPRRAMLGSLREPYTEFARDKVSRQCARLGYEWRTPMYARQFIEFAFSTPERVRLKGRTRKYIHVNALHDLLPANVRNRRTKADFSLAFERHLDEMRTLFVEELPAASSGYLSERGMKKLYECYRKWPVNDRPIWELWGAFSCAGLLDKSRDYSSMSRRN